MDSSPSRANAIQHGLTATTLLPEVLGPEILSRQLARFREQFRPATPSAELLVKELARHAAALELAEQAEAAVLRCGARGVSLMIPPAGDAEESRDNVLNAAVSSDALERLSRYRRGHEKGVHQALSRLEETKRAALLADGHQIPLTDQECRELLGRRFRDPWFRCPRCSQPKGYWLERRSRWECAACRFQVGLRTGTVLEGSPLPLAVWITAIRLLVRVPDASVSELAAATGCRRPQTLHRLASKIRAASTSSHSSMLLGDLDREFSIP